MKAGFFTMEDVKAVESMNLSDAKTFALGKISAQPNARPNNIKKATEAVNAATSIVGLMFTLSNFVLAHPSEGLKLV